MIAFVRGAFVQKTPACVFVDCNGVGYEVQISLNTYSDIANKEAGMLFTYLQVREDAHVLYGFATTQEKEMFVQLIAVNGVGAATARMMLSGMRADELARCIVQGNTKQLESIKGIGKKSAERIILELRDKLTKQSLDAGVPQTVGNNLQYEALSALVALGIGRSVAEMAVQKTAKDNPDAGLEELIKTALKNI